MNNTTSKNNAPVSKRSKQRIPQSIDGWFDDFISGVSSVVDVAAKILPLLPDAEKSKVVPASTSYTTGPVTWSYAPNGTVQAFNNASQPITICYTTGLNGDSGEPQQLNGLSGYDATDDLVNFSTGLVTISSTVVPGAPIGFSALTWNINDLGLDQSPVTVLGGIAVQAGFDQTENTYVVSLTTNSTQSVTGNITIQDAQGNLFTASVQPVANNAQNIYFPPGIEIVDIIPSLSLNLVIDTPSYNAATAKRSSLQACKS